MHRLPQHYMDVNGQIYVLPAVLPGKEPRIPIG